MQSIDCDGDSMTLAVKTQPSSKYRIQFIGRQGRVLERSDGQSGDLHLQGRRRLRARQGHRVERQLAWIQPVPVGASAPK